MPHMRSALLPRAFIVGAIALLGMSFARLAGEDLLPGLLGGAAIGAFAVLLSWPFRQRITEFEEGYSASELLGMRIATCGLCIAFAGWLVAVFVSRSLGIALAVVGIGTGFVGILRHWYTMLRGQDEA